MEAKEIQFFRDMLGSTLEDISQKGKATLDDMNESAEVYADPADRATAESDRALTLLLRDRERKLIKKIQQALTRIDDGAFGVCFECGEEIGLARLKARPMTTLCVDCKSRQEAAEMDQDE